jgi:hypothetical protein
MSNEANDYTARNFIGLMQTCELYMKENVSKQILIVKRLSNTDSHEHLINRIIHFSKEISKAMRMVGVHTTIHCSWR